MPSFQQLQYRMYGKRAAILLAFCAISALVYFGLQTEEFKGLVQSVQSMGKDSVPDKEDTSEELDLDIFDEFLDRASTQQLILKTTELVDDPTKQVLIRLDQQDRKALIADRLLGQAGDDRAITIGIAAKLDAMRVGQLIRFDNGLADSEQLDLLRSRATSYADHVDDRVNQQSHLARITALVLGEMLSQYEEGFAFTAQTVTEFKNVCRKFSDDEYVAKEVFSLLERVYIRAPADEQAKFSDAFAKAFENSKIAKLRALAADTENRLVNAEFELVDIFDTVESLQDEAVQELRGQILSVLGSGFVSSEGCQRIFSRIRDVVRYGNYQVAFELSDALQSKIGSKSALKDLAEKNRKLKHQLKLAGKKIPAGVLLELDGKNYVFKVPEAKVKAVCFMPKESFKEADVLLFNIIRKARRYATSKQFSLTAVYVDYGDSEAAMGVVKKLHRLVNALEICRIDANSEGGKRFVEQLSMIEPPLVVLLNQDEEVAAIDVTTKEFEKRFFELLE